MNKTNAYLEMVEPSQNIQLMATQPKFYDSMFKKIISLESSLNLQTKYVDILVSQEKFQKIVQESSSLFQLLDIEMNSDEEKHFDGVKTIINYKLNMVDKRIKQAKQKSMAVKIELEPEMPKYNNGYSLNKQRENTNRGLSDQNLLKMEHERMVEKFVETHIQSTRQRVLEIQDIQDMIGVHITAQNERIDVIDMDSKKSKKHIKDSSKYITKNGGRVVRRFMVVLLLCLSFVLLFLNFYYR